MANNKQQETDMSVQDISMRRIDRARTIVIYSFLCNVVICGIVFFSILIGLGSIGGSVGHPYLNNIIFYTIGLPAYGYVRYGGWILGVGIFIGSLCYYFFLTKRKSIAIIIIVLVVGMLMTLYVRLFIHYEPISSIIKLEKSSDGRIIHLNSVLGKHIQVGMTKREAMQILESLDFNVYDRFQYFFCADVRINHISRFIPAISDKYRRYIVIKFTIKDDKVSGFSGKWRTDRSCIFNFNRRH